MAEFEEDAQLDHLTCSICQLIYRSPRALPCLHCFCEGCIRDYIYSHNYDTIGKFPCPICQKDTLIPKDGVQAFPIHLQIWSLLDALQQNEHREYARNRPSNVQRNGIQSTVNNQNCIASEHTTQPSAPLREATRLSLGNGQHTINVEGVNNITHDNLGQIQLSGFSGNSGIPVQQNYHKALVIFGKYGSGICDFSNPLGLCITGQYGVPLIHISDRRDNRVMSFTLGGQVQSLFTCKGEVCDIACNKKEDLLYISNTKGERSLAFSYNLKGERKSAIGNVFTFEKPYGITVSECGNTIISCPEINRCYIIDSFGKMIQQFGKKGNGRDSFLNPLHLASNSKNDILVSDYGSDCIKIFDKNGKPKLVVGKFGCNNGDLHEPLGVTCDQYDNIIVADSGNDRIQVFSPSGKYQHMFLTGISKQGFPVDSCVVPKALAIVRDKLVVLFTGTNVAEVRVYRYSLGIKSKSCVCQ